MTKKLLLWSISCKDGCSSDTWAVAAGGSVNLYLGVPRLVYQFLQCPFKFEDNTWFQKQFFPLPHMYPFRTMHTMMHRYSQFICVFFLSLLSIVFSWSLMKLNWTFTFCTMLQFACLFLTLSCKATNGSGGFSNRFAHVIVTMLSHVNWQYRFSPTTWKSHSDWWIDMSTGNSDVTSDVIIRTHAKWNEYGTYNLSRICHNTVYPHTSWMLSVTSTKLSGSCKCQVHTRVLIWSRFQSFEMACHQKVECWYKDGLWYRFICTGSMDWDNTGPNYTTKHLVYYGPHSSSSTPHKLPL